MNKIYLKDIALITMGQSPESKFVSNDKIGLPLLNGPAEFTDRHPIPLQYTSEAKRIANPNDILFCVRGSTTGRMNIADQKYAIGRGLASIRHIEDEKLNSYVKALINVNLKKLLGGNLGSVFPNLTKDNLFNLECFIHSKEDQKHIAKVLSDLDAKIEVNNKINQELETMAKTLYDYWFVQFDFPNEDGKPYKSSGGKMVYNDLLKREIPEGWEGASLSSWIKNDKSGDWGKEQEQGNYTTKVSCIRGADLNGLNGKGDIKSPTRYILEKNEHKILETGDFIIEISGGSPTQSTGRMAFIIPETLERFENPLICSNFCKAVTLENEKAIYNFAQLWNRLYDAGVLFGWEGKTSGIKNLLFESFITNYKATKPTDELIELFYDKVQPIYFKIQKNLQENQKLSALRDWLLPMLMNGQVIVNNQKSKEKTAYKTSETLSMVAEETTHYETFKDIFDSINYDFEVATIAWLTERELKRSYGKKYIQKTYSNMQLLNILPAIKQQPVFEEHYWGMYSKAIEQTIKNKKFIKFEDVGYGKKVVKLHFKHLPTVSKWTKEDDYGKEFTNQLKKVLNIYEHPLIDKSMDRVELFNTVLECIAVLKTYEYATIYAKMKKWKMKEGSYKTKAEKFKPEVTRLMIGLVRELKEKNKLLIK